MSGGGSGSPLQPLRALVHTAWNAAADLIWPRVCPVQDCARTSDRPHRHLCSTCYASLPFMEIGSACSICGMPVAAKVEHTFVCEECENNRPAYEFARSALKYERPVDILIQDFKYRKALHLAEDFGDILHAAAQARFNAAAVDVVIPVPLHPHRRRERGFNQTEVLAEALARRLDRRLDTQSLIRRRDTEHQARISGTERRDNLHAAFFVQRPEFIRGRTVLLIDDVMTSGTTLAACAGELKKSGASRVWCLTLARALRR